MICPTCAAAGEMSRIEIGPSSRTCMHCAPFYDEQGRLHDHDANTTRTVLRCSRGHEWHETSAGRPCWCGWAPSPMGTGSDL